MSLPDVDDPYVYLLLDWGRRVGDPDEAVERAKENWHGVDGGIETALRAAARDEWDESELLDAYLWAHRNSSGGVDPRVRELADALGVVELLDD